MSDLNRVQVGKFNIQDSIKIDELKNGDMKKFISIEEFFKQNDKIILDSNDMTRFLNGVKIFIKEKNVPVNGTVKCIYNTDNQFIGTGIIKDGVLKRDIVI